MYFRTQIQLKSLLKPIFDVKGKVRKLYSDIVLCIQTPYWFNGDVFDANVTKYFSKSIHFSR